MTARMARLAMPAGPTALHQHRGPAWQPRPLLPEGEAHADPPPAADAPPVEPPKPTPPPAPAPAPTPAKPGDNLPDDPEALRKEILRLREENGKERNNAKDKAAKDAVDDLTQKLGRALGLIKDDEKLDPEKLAADLQSAKDAATDASVQLAVFKAAAGKADPVKLLDRNSFTSKLKGLDATAKDFDTKVAAAIDEAVKNDPTLKASGQAPGASAVPAAGGSGETGRTRVLGLGAAIEADRLASSTT